MPYFPKLSKLPRLNVPTKGLLWRTWWRLQSKSSRRLQVSDAMNSYKIDHDERITRIRTLIDIGLWGDHVEDSAEKEYNMARRVLGYEILLSIRSGMCSPEIVHLALEAGVDPNWRENNNHNDTLLTLFVRRLDEECFKVVVAAGADMSLCDNSGHTALHIVLDSILCTNQPARDFGQSIAEHLLDLGLDINNPGNRDNNQKLAPPIRSAIERWDTGLVQWALDRGARLDVVDDNLDTPLHWAATVHRGWDAFSCTPFMDLLLAHGAKVDQPNARGETPLWCALKWRNDDVAQWLLDHGASIHTIPHTFRDAQGYEHPDKTGEPLLQVLCENVELSEHTAELAKTLTGSDPNAWGVMTTHGTTLSQMLEQQQNQWRVLATASQLESLMEKEGLPAAPNRSLRL